MPQLCQDCHFSHKTNSTTVKTHWRFSGFYVYCLSKREYENLEFHQSKLCYELKCLKNKIFLRRGINTAKGQIQKYDIMSRTLSIKLAKLLSKIWWNASFNHKFHTALLEEHMQTYMMLYYWQHAQCTSSHKVLNCRCQSRVKQALETWGSLHPEALNVDYIWTTGTL